MWSRSGGPAVAVRDGRSSDEERFLEPFWGTFAESSIWGGRDTLQQVSGLQRLAQRFPAFMVKMVTSGALKWRWHLGHQHLLFFLEGWGFLFENMQRIGCLTKWGPRDSQAIWSGQSSLGYWVNEILEKAAASGKDRKSLPVFRLASTRSDVAHRLCDQGFGRQALLHRTFHHALGCSPLC